ncbi:putrescine transporter subunit: periplasmic-binding component of ABC superfamily [uncultured Alphaproteobacteria bacterium]|uniref:Putrescine-binding periplasmic protein n=1 Tax=uncultured Alphaproteobacteria bacterium TaxID=91750 RepID=A0A212KMC7_9PROT|nr:putrescine transporter subunit: periplasmic-binding component of ABC superfamily [uncultured Alphaproteobacteria bacterium]
MRTATFAALTAALTCSLAVVPANAADKVVHVYNWTDYIAEDTLENFTKETGVKVVYDVYDSNEVLEAMLLAGKSGYDVVFPTARPFAMRQIKSGLYRELDKSKLPNLKNMDPKLMKALESIDPGNAHGVPYMWGTTGVGINVDKVKEVLGDSADVDSLALLFKPENAKKLAACGITFLDDQEETFAMALRYLGKDVATTSKKDIDAAADVFKKIRPYIKYFHGSQYVNDLANGDVCVSHGYSGDILQAKARAEEAGNGVKIRYIIPKEGAVLWTDVMLIPKDAPNPDEAHAYINYIMKPEVVAAISNFVAYANANKAATPLVDEEVRTDPGIYPSEAVMDNLYMLPENGQDLIRYRVRAWTRVKTGQ